MTVKKFEFRHSLKNIPIPQKDVFMKKLISKTEDFIQRIRWKAFFFINPPKPNPDKAKNTTLSAFVWSKGLTPEPEIKWSIVMT